MVRSDAIAKLSKMFPKSNIEQRIANIPKLQYILRKHWIEIHDNIMHEGIKKEIKKLLDRSNLSDESTSNDIKANFLLPIYRNMRAKFF